MIATAYPCMMIRNVVLEQGNVHLKKKPSEQHNLGGMVGSSKAMQDVLALIRTISGSDATVLISGETGCGKELAARLIHQLSKRGHRRFVTVNCGAIPEALLESELFGHERGAFTGAVSQAKGKFELAEGGTIFLDEVGDLPPPVQVKLLRVLQEKEFPRVGGTADIKADIRVIAATNQNLEAMMERNQFRHDLYYRLNVIPLYVPSLRERLEDLPELARHFITRYADRTGKPIQGLTPEALNLCFSYTWPGNIRELENAMERGVILASEHCTFITRDLLPPALRDPALPTPALDLTALVTRMDWASLLQSLRQTGSLTNVLARLEWAITNRVVAEYGGNKSRAARALGRTYRWLRKLESEMSDQDTSPTEQNRSSEP
ncbi:MAG: nif-specific transcriptional activator NifA [Nitrospira sp.]|nr:MAG: nif-specific transcriptional activator NifA [Nitrospira sp.]